jgi:hypothetical protein
LAAILNQPRPLLAKPAAAAAANAAAKQQEPAPSPLQQQPQQQQQQRGSPCAAAAADQLSEVRRLLKEKVELLASGLYARDDPVVLQIDARVQALAEQQLNA